MSMKPKYHAHRESLGDKVFMALAIQKGVVDQTLFSCCVEYQSDFNDLNFES